jgi:hypothetical protein
MRKRRVTLPYVAVRAKNHEQMSTVFETRLFIWCTVEGGKRFKSVVANL